MMAVELKPKHSKAISGAIKKLNKALEEVRQYIPDANFYLEDSNNFLTMSGDSHDESGAARQDRVLQHDTLHHSGGGGW